MCSEGTSGDSGAESSRRTREALFHLQELCKGSPSHIGGFFADDETSGLRAKAPPDIEMKMTRNRSALWEDVHIKVHEAEIIELDEPGLFGDFPARCRHHVDVCGFDMTAWLQPPGQLSMMNQDHLRKRRMEHES